MLHDAIYTWETGIPLAVNCFIEYILIGLAGTLDVFLEEA